MAHDVRLLKRMDMILPLMRKERKCIEGRESERERES